MGKSLVEHFARIEDPRQGRVAYDLVEMLVVVTCALLAEVDTFVDIAQWARCKESWLRRFLRLENGLPSHDTLNRLFRLLDPQAFESAFRAWVADTLPVFGQIALDGKSLRGARRAQPVHLVSAFATQTGLCLAQQAVPDKGSEVAAVPVLLRALDVQGCLVSLDALSCRQQIAGVIRERGADYLLAVKGNQPKLRAALEQAFAAQADAPRHGQELLGHGRHSIQTVQVLANAGRVDPTEWPDCRSLGRIRSVRHEKDRPGQEEIRYYISSTRLTPEELALAARRHWAIENDLHWRLDVMMREDACAVRRDHAPENLAILRRLLLNVLKQDTSPPKLSLRLRRKLAGWDDDERMRVLGITPL